MTAEMGTSQWKPTIPRHWMMSRIGFEARVKARLGWKGLKADEYVDEGYILLSTPNIKNRHIDFHNVNYITEARFLESPEIILNEGDVLLAKDGSTLGICNVARQLPAPATVNSSVAVIRPRRSLNSIFLYYLISANQIQSIIQQMKGGMGVPHLFQADLVKFPIPVPPLSEQQAIAAFLDRKTAQIDELISKKKRMIELLQEKRQALISQAVTKGLDSNVPIKDSGIEWLGQVPKHWSVCSIRREWKIIDCKHLTVSFTDVGIPLASIGEVQQFDIDLSKAHRTTNEEFLQLIGGGRKPTTGDIIYSRNATVGEASFVNSKEDFAMGQDVCLIRSHLHNQRFLVYQLRSPSVMRQVEAIVVGATFKRINVAQINNLIVCVPPRQEQDKIAEFCDHASKSIEQVVTTIGKQVEGIREYRQTLISAAVTGKIDVREEVAA